MSQLNWAGYPWTEIVRATDILRIEVLTVPPNWGRVEVPNIPTIYIPAPIYVSFSVTRQGRTSYFPAIALDTFPAVLPLPDVPNAVDLDYSVSARDPGWVFAVQELNGRLQ